MDELYELGARAILVTDIHASGSRAAPGASPATRAPSRTFPVMRVITALLLLLGLAACAAPAGSDSGAASTSPTAVDIAPANNDLLIVLDRGDGTEPERYTLTCVGVPEGNHPAPAAACAHLEGLDDPFAPLPTDMACTEQYGGPETVRITGRWHDQPVDAGFARTDGCRIAQWESLGPVLPPVEGASRLSRSRPARS